MKKRRQQHGAPQSGATGTVRIIAGQWKGRRLAVADVAGLRPTGDRIRETLFSWLQFELAGAHCLDLFAGSGALGLEAASRGAASVTLIEKDTAAQRTLATHLQTLEASQVTLVKGDARRFLTECDSQSAAAVNQSPPAEPIQYHCVFLDPPFQLGLHQPMLDLLANCDKLAENALVYIERAASETYTLPQNTEVVRSSKAGNVCFELVRFTTGQLQKN